MTTHKKMIKDAWNPQQYQKFEKERNLPFYDLLKLIIPKKEMNIIDLGCGTGKLTKILHETLQVKRTLGIDSSPQMLDESKGFKQANLDFMLMNIEDFKAQGKFDLVFSNAALQWIPDHFELFTKLAHYLTEDGQFAIQMPANYDYPTHVAASELARQSPFKEELNGESLDHHLLTIEEYSKLIFQLGFKHQIVRMQVYPHILDSTESVIEWVKGSLLTYYQSRLSPEKYDLFFKLYCDKITAFFGDTRPFYLPFKRILIWAQR